MEHKVHKYIIIIMQTIKEYIINNDCIELNINNGADNIFNESAEKEAKFDINKVEPMQIPSEKALKKMVDLTNPSAPKKDKGGSGLYEFDELIKNEPDLMNIAKGPYYPMYCAFLSNDTFEDDKPDPKQTKFYGCAGFSLNFFNGKNKTLKDLDSKQIKTLNQCLHIILWQTDPQYAKLGLAKRYVDLLQAAAKEAKKRGISIKTPKDNKQVDVYKSLGFKELPKIPGYMYLKAKSSKKDVGENDDK